MSMLTIYVILAWTGDNCLCILIKRIVVIIGTLLAASSISVGRPGGHVTTVDILCNETKALLLFYIILLDALTSVTDFRMTTKPVRRQVTKL